MNIAPACLAAVSALLLITSCTSMPDNAAEYREQKIYRTGSNIPTKDYGAANIEVGKSEVMSPMNRPAAGAMMRKGGG